ncbi:MAG TPA: recombination mediator RecR [Patescibacteria group bacterium]|nr:recombination mediator RecR [Patescibacteria group bacterium]
MNHPPIIQNLINNFAALPGIGQKTAERLVFYLLKNESREKIEAFGENLLTLKKEIQTCPVCGNYTNGSGCQLCAEPKRDRTKVCLVAEAQDILYLEKTAIYNGLYHVLNGLLAPVEGITPDKLNVTALGKRLAEGTIKEVIMGFNPTMEGESTIIYLKKLIREKYPQIKITRLSRGLPMGGDLEYADEITLQSAMDNRTEI